MKKILLSSLASLILLVSCDDTAYRVPQKFKKTGSNQKSTKNTKDSTLVIIDSDTIKSIDTLPNYKCKYPDVVQKILLEKRTQIFMKEERDISFYSKSFLDVFEVDKTHSSILIYYDKLVDSAVVKISLRGKIDFGNITSKDGVIIK